MNCCSNFKKVIRYLISLRGGLFCLCIVYEICIVWAVASGSPPLLLKTFSFLLSQNLMSIATGYYVLGFFTTIVAVIGVLFHEKKFILPLLVFDVLLLVSCIITFGYLVQSKSVFLHEEKNFVRYVGQIGFGYFAALLEYNVYQELVRKTRVRPEGVPESLIILPLHSSRPINPRAVLQQYVAQRTEDAENEFHYVYGVSNSMLHFLRTAPRTSDGRRPRSAPLPGTVLYNANAESVALASSGPSSALSTVFYNAQQASSFHRVPPPPYRP